jgi:ketosteroid isomerase-like protein
MGKIEDLVMRNNAAFRRGDFEGALEGWSPEGELTPLPGGRTYRGHEEIQTFFSKDIYELPEFDFRIYTVLEQHEFALVFGRYSIYEGSKVVDRGIFWILEVRDDEVISFEAYETVGEAFAEFRSRLTVR